jgi:hypothetical protein
MKKSMNQEQEVMDKVIYVRLTRDEYLEVQERADLARISASRYLVSCGLNQKIKQVKKARKSVGSDREKLEDLMWQLKKLGRNINQLAHCYEDVRLTGEGVIDEKEIALAGEKVKSLLKQLEERL